MVEAAARPTKPSSTALIAAIGPVARFNSGIICRPCSLAADRFAAILSRRDPWGVRVLVEVTNHEVFDRAHGF